jgi:mannosyltransferase
VVPHGIDLQRFSPPRDRFESWAESGLPGRYGIGTFGRVRPDKGSDVFVDAMIEALPGLPGATAIIAGLAQPKHLDFEASLRQKIAAAGLSAGQVADWYRRCLVCIACPRYEPFGLTPFEAAATGCALICSRTGAFEALVEPGVNGDLVEPGDAPGLARATLSLLSDPTAALAMGHAARDRVYQRFTLEREAAGIGEVYRQMFAHGLSH